MKITRRINKKIQIPIDLALVAFLFKPIPQKKKDT
jgi:hypothetical protein